MATLYVENVPDDLYQALRDRAKSNRRSIAAEVMELLRQQIPTAAELKARRQFLKQVSELRSRHPLSAGPFASTKALQREDRER